MTELEVLRDGFVVGVFLTLTLEFIGVLMYCEMKKTKKIVATSPFITLTKKELKK